MGYIAIALLLGLAAGLVTGGRPSNAGRRPLRGTGALGGAVVLQVLPELVDVSETTGLACVLGSYALLLGFGLANMRIVGVPVVLVGLLCNVAVITANGGMPVRAEAILAVDRSADLGDLDFGAKRHLEEPGDRLTFLGDVVPVRPLGQVLSFGDLILAVGIADVVFRLLRPAAPVRRRRRPTAAEILALLPGPAVLELPETA